MSKTNYDDYFLAMCYLVAMRSIDPSTKCGAVLVSKNHKVLSTGYNGPIRGSDDTLIPLVRPAKYAHMLHSEENCLLTTTANEQDMVGSTMYVTGAPCHHCLRMILQKGVDNIVYTSGNLAVMQDDAELAICKLMLSYAPKVNIRVVDNLPAIVDLFGKTQDYIKSKNPSKF